MMKNNDFQSEDIRASQKWYIRKHTYLAIWWFFQASLLAIVFVILVVQTQKGVLMHYYHETLLSPFVAEILLFAFFGIPCLFCTWIGARYVHKARCKNDK